jgi:DNA modification methylase
MKGSQVSSLRSMDWSLKDADTDRYSATVHPYHARFIPQIPERLISEFTDEGDTVLDPFNGSGTTTMVAGAMGRHGVGVDINPLATLVARVKSRRYDVDALEEHAEGFLREAERRVRAVDSQSRIDRFGDETEPVPDVPVEIPDFPDKERWYKPNVLRQMGALFHLVKGVDDDRKRDFYRVCFSAITKTVCRSDEDYTYIGDNMYPDKETNSLEPVEKDYDVYGRFEGQVRRSLESVRSYAEQDPSDCEVHRADSRNMGFLDDDSVDLAVTSPPYANAVDYARYHRLSFYWLGFPVRDTRDDEIGARSKRGRKSSVEDYFEESREVYEEVYRVLRDGARFCVVVGDSQHRNERVRTVDKVAEMCEGMGYENEGRIEREVSNQSMGQKNITEEAILILRKPA